MIDLLREMDWVLPLRSPLLTPFFEGVTALGYVPFFVVAIATVWWFLGSKNAWRLGVMVLLAGAITFFLKDLFDDPRPGPEFRVEGHHSESFGLPSGHTLISLVFWGWLALMARRPWFTVSAIIIVSLIAFSRLYLGLHDLEDVIGGALAGGLILGLGWWASRYKLFENKIWALSFLIALALGVVFWPAEKLPTRYLALIAFAVGWWEGGRELSFQWKTYKLDRTLRNSLTVVTGLIMAALICGALYLLLKAVPGGTTIKVILGALIVGWFFASGFPLTFGRLGNKSEAD